MKFIIQNNLINVDHLSKIEVATRNFPREFVGVIPFSHEITSNTELDGIDYIPYGSTLLTKLAAKLGWTGLSFNYDKFNYGEAIRYRCDMLNDEHILSVSEAIKFLRSAGSNKNWFIRPSHDLKQFSGQVINSNSCADWLEKALSSEIIDLDKDTLLVLSTPKDIQAEWRWFIINGKVIDGSMYRCRGALKPKHENDKLVILEAQKLADNWLPNINCVMDVAVTSEYDEPKIIEFNSINASGFYDHDFGKIFNSWYSYYSA